MRLFPLLVELAAVGHRDIVLVRDIICSMPRKWLVEGIEEHANPLLERGDWETYRRLAELYVQLGDTGLLRRLVDSAATSSDYDVREVADDFRGASVS
jgi:hypothetical protein